MDQLQQCPVCTLYLHSGMSMEDHLDTHPKDQVIRALCKMSGRFSSRCTTPAQSERSYCSRSRTPASTFDGRSTPKTYSADERRKRTPRTPAPRSVTPADSYRSDPLYDTRNSSTPAPPSSCFMTRGDPPPYARSGLESDASEYMYMADQTDEIEVKYSRSDEYMNQGIQPRPEIYTYNAPNSQPPPLRPAPRIRPDSFDVFTKPSTNSNIALLKTNVTPVQYVNQTVKPLQFMVPAAQGFVQAQNENMIISSGVNELLQPVNSKNIVGPVFNQINHMTSAAAQFTPGTTVVTQNSQFFYREMVHNIDGKPYLSAVPAVVSVREEMPSAAQNPGYPNVMVVSPYSNSACMYPTQHIMTTTSNAASYDQPNYTPERRVKVPTRSYETNQSLVIEIGQLASDRTTEERAELIHITQESVATKPSTSTASEESEQKNEIDLTKTKKGLKILSNIKVEVPIQHHKSMLNGVMDLTGDADVNIASPCLNASEIIPEMEEEKKNQSNCDPLTSEGDSNVINTFSVIKNIGNPSVYRESTPKSNITESKLDVDQNDSSSIPDLTCKEKASISPCSELSGDFADNSLDSNSTSIKTEPEKADEPISIFRSSSLLHNVYKKKEKKKLEIKNSKNPPASEGPQSDDSTPGTSSSQMSQSASLESPTKSKFSLPSNLQTSKPNNVQGSPSKQEVSGGKPERNPVRLALPFDADTEEQSMDIEPISHSTSCKEMFDQVPKVENSQNDSEQSQTCSGDKKEFAQLENMRPVNVIAYGSLSNLDSHKEYDASKDRFVSMMSDNYFGDNIIGDYFTAERCETFTHSRVERAFGVQKTELPTLDEEHTNEYMWGESSHALPTFMQESYKVGEYEGTNDLELEETQYAELRSRAEEYDRMNKIEVERANEGEVALDICADERMPPRGELSGQESNGDMDTPWSGIYHNMNSSTSYDLTARETWLSDGSDIDMAEKRDHLVDELENKMKMELSKRMYKCSTCGLVFNCPKERRVHRAKEHPMPSTACSKAAKQIRKQVTTTTVSIKKEEKTEEIIFQSAIVAAQVAAPITPGLVEILESQLDTKPLLKAELVIKQENRRRRCDYVCPVCKVDFLNELGFHAHLKLHPLECLTCGKYFYKRTNLQLHLRTHLAIRNYKCELCEKRFTTKQKLNEHSNVHTGAAPVKCSHCTATFRRHSNMIQHRNRHHLHLKKKVRDYVCHCGDVYHSRRKLLWHKETHDGKPKACTYCSDKFVHAASLTRHIRRAHNSYYVPDDARPRENVECPVCKQVYLKKNIELHLQTHSGKKLYSCVICNKSFSTKWNLKLHRWTHANRSAKPFKCALCKGAFIRQSDYISHMNSHKSVRPYTCNYCGCQFIRKYNCQRHVKEHETTKKYVCKVAECGKMFHRSYYLSEHMRVHSGARPFSCNICGKTSSNKSNHNKHVKIHHAREPVATEG